MAQGGIVAISEARVSEGTLGSIQACARDAAEKLGIDLAGGGSEIVDALDSFVYRWQKGKRPKVDEEDDLSLMLGSLWGEQVVRELNWEWATVTFHDHGDAKAIGVVSPDRSMAIYPFHFVYGCLEKGASVTIMLSYNMLKDDTRIPAFPAKGYENIMDGIRHIVPRD